MVHRPKIITGNDPLITPKIMSPDGEDCVEVLERLLRAAKQGEMSWFVGAAGGPNDFGAVLAGNNPAQMNLGIDVAKQSILERVKVR